MSALKTIDELKTIIKNFGLSFDHHLNDVNSKLEILAIQLEDNELTEEIFLDFLNEHTEWNICDCCAKIEGSYGLIWLDGSLSEEQCIIADKINATTDFTAICDECFESYRDRATI